MLDIKFLRENPEIVKENIRKKFQDRKLVLVDEVIELIGIHALDSAQIREDGRVDVAAARAHAEALERRQAHRRVNRLTALNGRDRRAAAQVTADDVEVFDVFAQESGEPVRDVLM